jgi:hypothetical protein
MDSECSRVKPDRYSVGPSSPVAISERSGVNSMFSRPRPARTRVDSERSAAAKDRFGRIAVRFAAAPTFSSVASDSPDVAPDACRVVSGCDVVTSGCARLTAEHHRGISTLFNVSSRCLNAFPECFNALSSPSNAFSAWPDAPSQRQAVIFGHVVVVPADRNVAQEAV